MKYSYIFVLTVAVLSMDAVANEEEEEGYFQKVRDAWDETRTILNYGWFILSNETRPIREKVRPILDKAKRVGYEDLVSFPPEAYSRDTYNRTPLMEIVAQGDLSKVELLIATGADVNAADLKGKTVLMYAAEAGYHDVVELLIKNGAWVNVRDTGGIREDGLVIFNDAEIEPGLEHDGRKWGDGGRTALMYAIFGGHDRSVELLLNAGAITGMRNFSNGMTDLMEAVQRGHENIVKLLINAPEVEINIDINKLGGGWWSQFYNPKSWGRDIDARDYLTKTALMMAVEKNRYGIVRALVEKGADVNTETLTGRTPLITAVQNGHFPIVAFLVHAGAFVHTTDTWEQTALGYAVAGGHHGIARFLLHWGANSDTRLNNWVGTNALMIAAENGDAQMVELLIEFGADIHVTFVTKTPLMYAAESDDLETVKVLLAAGAFVEARSASRQTAIQYARDPEVIQLLMQYQEQQTRKLKEN